MFKFAATISVALLAISGASGVVVPRKEAPKGWATAWLEDYSVYHTRYLALGCHLKHTKPAGFFDQCCHPLLKHQELSSRPAQCTPSKTASSSAAAAEPTSTVPTPADDDNDDDLPDCEDDDDEDDTPAPPPPPPASTPKPKTTSTTPKSTPTPSKPASKPAPTTPASGDQGVNKGGFATFYYQEGNKGACGEGHGDGDLIAAMNAARYGNLNAKSSLCGKFVKITNTKNGKSVRVKIVDACPGCVNNNSIDLSVGAFNAIAPPSDGMVPITWVFD